MNARTSHEGNGRASSSTPGTLARDDPFTALSRQQMQAMNELIRITLNGTEKLRRCQVDTAHRAKALHDKCQTQLDTPCSSSELMKAQSELLSAEAQATLRYWQDLMGIFSATQAELLNQFTSTFGASSERLARLLPASLQAPAWPVPTSGEQDNPAAQVWKNLMTATEPWRTMLQQAQAGSH